MQLMSSQAFVEHSTFQDNAATAMNHGITMITSKTEIYNSTVTFSEGFSDRINLSKVDCGFFSLILGSTLVLGSETRIERLKALN